MNDTSNKQNLIGSKSGKPRSQTVQTYRSQLPERERKACSQKKYVIWNSLRVIVLCVAIYFMCYQKEITLKNLFDSTQQCCYCYILAEQRQVYGFHKYEWSVCGGRKKHRCVPETVCYGISNYTDYGNFWDLGYENNHNSGRNTCSNQTDYYELVKGGYKEPDWSTYKNKLAVTSFIPLPIFPNFYHHFTMDKDYRLYAVECIVVSSFGCLFLVLTTCVCKKVQNFEIFFFNLMYYCYFLFAICRVYEYKEKETNTDVGQKYNMIGMGNYYESRCYIKTFQDTDSFIFDVMIVAPLAFVLLPLVFHFSRCVCARFRHLRNILYCTEYVFLFGAIFSTISFVIFTLGEIFMFLIKDEVYLFWAKSTRPETWQRFIDTSLIICVTALVLSSLFDMCCCFHFCKSFNKDILDHCGTINYQRKQLKQQKVEYQRGIALSVTNSEYTNTLTRSPNMSPGNEYEPDGQSNEELEKEKNRCWLCIIAHFCLYTMCTEDSEYCCCGFCPCDCCQLCRNG